MKIILARHGETPWNAEGRYQGKIDIPLSAIGERQAVNLGERLRGVEMVSTFNGEPQARQTDPVILEFPGMWDLVPTDKPGITVTELRTPVGRLRLSQELLPEGVAGGTAPAVWVPIPKDGDPGPTAPDGSR